MELRNKRVIVFIIGIASILMIVVTVSYAYFTALGETRTQEATISTGTATATFRDGDTGITGELSFGESLTKKFMIENTGTIEANVKMYFKDLLNTYTEGSLTYTLLEAESEEGQYTEVVSKTNIPRSNNPATKTLINILTIPVGKTYYYNLVIRLNYLTDINQDSDLSAKFSSSFKLEDINYKSVVEKIIASSQGVRSNFEESATTDEGVYEMEDDYGISYYYRGAVEDNYVKYGANKDGQEMWWRIIRINGDGSVRMVYDGTQGYANGTANDDRFIKTSQPFNALYNDAKYVGWMYGPAGTTASTSKEEAQKNIADSDAKKVVDAWYKENIEDTGYGMNVSDEIFCNDRTTPGKTETGWSTDTGLGYGTRITAYGATARTSLWNGKVISPTFKCLEKNDAFTAEDTRIGNGALTYPVGLITTDEILAAGSGKFNTSNVNYYLYKSNSYYQWSLSPYHFYSSNAKVFIANTSGQLNGYSVNNTSGAVAPVINLTPEYANSMIGTGTITDPYRSA